MDRNELRLLIETLSTTNVLNQVSLLKTERFNLGALQQRKNQHLSGSGRRCGSFLKIFELSAGLMTIFKRVKFAYKQVKVKPTTPLTGNERIVLMFVLYRRVKTSRLSPSHSIDYTENYKLVKHEFFFGTSAMNRVSQAK